MAERRASREVLALYEISGAFVEHLSLDRTLEAVGCTIVETFGVDAAAIRMVDRRRGELVTRAVHVAEGALEEPLRALLSRPQQLGSLPVDLVASSDARAGQRSASTSSAPTTSCCVRSSSRARPRRSSRWRRRPSCSPR